MVVTSTAKASRDNHTSEVQMMPLRITRYEVMARIQRNGNVTIRFPSGVFPLMAVARATDTAKIEMRVEIVGDSINHFFFMNPLAIIEKAKSKKKNGSNKSTSGADDC